VGLEGKVKMWGLLAPTPPAILSVRRDARAEHTSAQRFFKPASPDRTKLQRAYKTKIPGGVGAKSSHIFAFFRFALTLLLTCALAACGRGGGRAACPAGLRCLEAGNAADPQTLDPNKAQTVWEGNILYDMFVGLTQFDTRGKVVPGMATAWEVSPDGLTWTFHLRAAQWSDGVPVTADDFVYSLQRIQNPLTASPYAYLYYLIAGTQRVNEGKAAPASIGAHALDPHTLQLVLTHPAPYLPRLLVHNSALPIPAHVVKQWGDAWLDPSHIATNGPYVLKDWQLGQRILLARNPRFWDNGNVCFDEIRYYPTAEASTAERRVESGEVDVNYTFASPKIDFLRGRLPGYVHAVPYLANWYLSMNERVAKLQDRRVRLAMSLGMDREFLASKLTRGGAVALLSFTPPGMSDYTAPPPPAWGTLSFAKRQEMARGLMKAAGYGPDHPFHVEYKYQSSAKVLAAAMQADWRAIGIDITLAPEESQIFYADLNAGNFEIAYDGWAMDYDDPMTFLELLASEAGPQNHSHYSSPRYDGLLAQANQTRDIAARAKILAQAEALALADVAVAPIMTDSARNLVNPDLTGWADNPANWHLKRYLCRNGVPPK
jgi:oligopeptide transport system substrate-binding protein